MSGRGRGRGRFSPGGGRGRGRSDGGRFQRDEGPPAEIVEAGQVAHDVESELLCRWTLTDKVPYFNAGIYLQNKRKIGKVDEILGKTAELLFTIKMDPGVLSKSFQPNDLVFIGTDKLLPLVRFTNPEASKGRGGGGRGAGGRGGRGGGRGGFGGRGGGRGYGFRSLNSPKLFCQCLTRLFHLAVHLEVGALGDAVVVEEADEGSGAEEEAEALVGVDSKKNRASYQATLCILRCSSVDSRISYLIISLYLSVCSSRVGLVLPSGQEKIQQNRFVSMTSLNASLKILSLM